MSGVVHSKRSGHNSPQFLKIYIGYLLASSLQDGLDGLEVCSRDVHGNGIPNGTGNPMGMGLKH